MKQETPRPVILHGHMFKNAGTSIDTILANNFGSNFIDHRDDDHMMKGKQQYLESYLKKNQEIKALSSHHLPLPLNSISGIDARIVIMLRHPIVRVASVYRFEHIQNAKTPGAIAAKKYDFSDYVKWRLDERPVTISNFFVNYCSSLSPDKTLLSRRLEIAWENLKHFTLAGIVEEFDSSMLLLKSRLRDVYPDFHVSRVHKNRTVHIDNTHAEKMRFIENELGSAGFQRLMDSNTYDNELYKRALKKLNYDLMSVNLRTHHLSNRPLDKITSI